MRPFLETFPHYHHHRHHKDHYPTPPALKSSETQLEEQKMTGGRRGSERTAEARPGPSSRPASFRHSGGVLHWRRKVHSK